MAYVSLNEYKTYIRELTQGQPTGFTSAENDAMQVFLNQAQKLVEDKTERVFEAQTETRYFGQECIPFNQPQTLFIDRDLLTVTTLTNGDATVISASDYWLYPFNDTPKYAIVLKSARSWLFGTDGRVSIAGTWGFMSTPTDNVKRITMQLAWWIQQKRMSLGDVTLLDGGAFTVDGSFPSHISEWLVRHRRKS